MKRYIFTHDDNFVAPEGYETINNKHSDLDHRIWSELAGYKMLFDKINSEKAENGMLAFDDNDWICLNHDHRYFDKDYCNRHTVAAPMVMDHSLAQQYAFYHNIEDLKLCGQSLKEEFPHLVKNFENCLNANVFIPYTICITTVGQFKDYWNFLFRVLSNFHKKLGDHDYEGRLEFVKSHPELYTGDGKDNRPEYQSRIEAFLCERLATMYWGLCATRFPVFTATIQFTREGETI